MNMRAAFLHILADALGSVIVIVSALINKFQKQLNVPKKIIDLIDPMLCICLVILILGSAIPLCIFENIYSEIKFYNFLILKN